MAKEIIITVEGGVIQDIEDIPNGIIIKVMDFDEDIHFLEKEDPRVEVVDGSPCYVTIWKRPGK